MFLAPHIRWVDVADDVVFLDLKADRYSAASGSVAARWRDLTHGLDGTDPLVGAILPRAEDGVGALFLERGYVSASPPVASAREPPPGLGLSRGLAAASIIRRTAGQLKREGLWSAYRDTLRLRARSHARDLATSLTAFVSGENLTSLRQAPKDCLPRSLALHRYLSACGISSQHVIGVQTRPFSAHAWVENAGKALLEVKPPHHQPIARISPGA